jgi:hypothetical protein
MNRAILAKRLGGLLLLSLLLQGAAVAADNLYKFEMVIFERPGVTIEPAAESQDDAPKRNLAGRLDAMAAGGKRLGPVAYTLKQKGMIVHEHLAWIQSPRGLDSKSWYQVGDGRMNGLVRMTRGRFLHLDAELTLRDTGGRAKLYRRMRSGELHYVDHPKFGILIEATPLEGASGAGAADGTSSGEPKPAKPGAS